MIEIEIQNFQSIRKVLLTVNGFTGIQGKSNIGKSAIVRAIKCALTGAVGNDFVRHEEKCERKTKGNQKCKCQSTVRLECPQWKLVWEKGDAINRYTFRERNGPEKVYDSISRGTPEFLLPDFQSIKVGDSPELIQVVGQFRPIFLLDQSGPAVADVLSDVAKLDNINLAMTLVNKDRKEAVSTRKVREKDIQSLLRALEGYKELDRVASQSKQVRTLYDALEEKKDSVEQLGVFIQQVQERLLQIKTLEVAVGPDLPDGEVLEKSSEKCDLLEGFCSRAFEITGAIKGLSKIDQVVLPDTRSVENGSKKYKALTLLQSRLEVLEAEMKPLSDLDSLSLPESGDLAPPLERLRRFGTWIQELLQIKESLRGEEVIEGPLPPVEAIREKLGALALLERALGVEGDLGALERAHGKAERDVQEVLESFEELGVCPTCSQPVEAGRCTMGGHQ